MEKIRTVELFAGVGGFRLGLEQASERFQTVWANQWEPSTEDQWAFRCYAKHFGESHNHVCKDIAAIDKDKIPDHDLLVGGFPCQDYSIAKKGAKGIEGKKGVLWWQIDEILDKKRPLYVLLENVDRLIRSPAKQKGRDLSIILRCFYEKGYAAEWRVINAADYGQAQRRRRTFLLAYHNDTEIFKQFAEETCRYGVKRMHTHVMTDGVLAKAFPVSGHGRSYLDNWIDEFSYEDMASLSREQSVYFYNAGAMMNGRIYSVDVVPEIEHCIPIRDILQDGEIDSRYFIKEEDLPRWRYMKGAKNELRHRKDGSTYCFSEGVVAFPEPLDRPSRTMLTSESNVSRTSHVVVDPQTKKLRTLTPVECERLNGFPDGWTEGMPERMRYFTMGNALVVPLVSAIGKIINDIT
ncbi:Modification methylase HhaI [uncultured Clostridium sp.]|uniref:Cytosine-specific methyltransferase n=1 Tax=Flintibacter hominis TaxID=2763048 RepID=A0A8J6J7E8_9FIRM|nr:DNA (cytosine-5-)-methyltransferase [Flintibacter hominis]MBC5722066.1 DNA (cytosine-5-)-methyltransferase [Flintibacter hominis]SCH83304.1 Modification methylase HhaI [uncultured Clostridium sp.]